MVVVATTDAAAMPAVVLALWRGEAADRTATKVEAATEAAAAAAQQQQWCHGGGGGDRHGGRGDGGNSSGGDNKGSGGNRGSGGNQWHGDQQVVYLCREHLFCFFYKFISYLVSYVGPIQTGFLMAFLPRLLRNRNRAHFKTSDRNRKNRNPEDSYRNWRPSFAGNYRVRELKRVGREEKLHQK